MSHQDPLAIAMEALRRVDEAPPTDVAATRARVLSRAASARERTKGRRVVRWVAPLAAALAVSTAWAGSRGALPSLWHRVAHVLAGRDDVATTIATSRPSPPVATAPKTSVSPEAAPSSDVPVVAIDTLPRARVSGALGKLVAPTPAADSDQTAHADADAIELALYAKAHRAHFVDGDPRAALDAWDAYLAAEPDGRFAPEARYNRALTLLRLGRRAEAREALVPFTQGAYRAEEARELVRAIDRGATRSGE